MLIEQGLDIEKLVNLQQAVVGQLSDQVDDIVLRGRILAQQCQQRLPDGSRRVFAVTTPDKLVARRVQAMLTAGDRIGQHIPNAVARGLSSDLNVAAQARIKLGNPKPIGTEQ